MPSHGLTGRDGMKVMYLLAALPLAACMTLTSADARHVTYACADGTELKVTYGGSTARIDNPGGPLVTLQRMQVSSGVLYTSANRKIRGDGDEITYAVGRAEPVTCTAQAPPPA